MSSDLLAWFQLFPPKQLDLDAVTAALRPLASRPKLGLAQVTPLVVFECWVSPGAVRWLVGMEQALAHSLPHQMCAQVPSLNLVPCPMPVRPMPTTAMGVRLQGMAYPLRVDMAGPVALATVQIAGQLRTGEHAVAQWVVGPCTPRHGTPPTPLRLSEALGLATPAKPDVGEQRAWRLKVQEPLFATRGRLGAVAGSAHRAGHLTRVLFDALELANSAHARLAGSYGTAGTPRRLHAVMSARRRWSAVVNASELGVLLSWPVDGVNLPGAVGPSLYPAPTALLRSADERSQQRQRRVLGVSLHPADGGQLVTMSTSSVMHHTAITGPTGSGKSNLAAQLILDDAAAGHSVLVVEPKGDLVDDVLARLPKHRLDEVVLIEPSEHGLVVGLNPLAGPREQAERRADELLELFKAEFGTAIGPRSADCLLHTLITAARLPDGRLTDVPILLTNASFRRQALTEVSDAIVLAPFWSWFDSLSEAERGQVVAPILNKTRAFTARAALRRTLGQAQPQFQLDELFTKRRIVLVNLNRGLLGPGTCRLLGGLLLSQCWQAIQRRAAMPETQRQPTTVVIDEFQDFVGALDFGDALAQARGLGVGFTLINQNLDQLSPTLKAATLANCRSRVTFRPAHGDARALAAVLGGGVTPDDLERLGAFQAVARVLVDSAPSQPFAIRTVPLAEPTNDVEQLRRASLDRYGRDGRTVDEDLTRRWQGGGSDTDGPIGVSRRKASS